MSVERSVLIPELTVDEYCYYMGKDSIITREEILEKFAEHPSADALTVSGKRFSNGDGTFWLEAITVSRPNV